jgi:hypothetical protein
VTHDACKSPSPEMSRNVGRGPPVAAFRCLRAIGHIATPASDTNNDTPADTPAEPASVAPAAAGCGAACGTYDGLCELAEAEAVFDGVAETLWVPLEEFDTVAVPLTCIHVMPLVLVLPGGHGAHATEPGAGATAPALHGSHTSTDAPPAAPLARPAAQSSHRPPAPPNVPAGHGGPHADEPGGVCVPGAHGEHVVLPAGAAELAAHWTGVGLHEKPAGQGWHNGA